MTLQNSKFTHRFTVKQILGGYVAVDPDGGHASRLIRFRAEANQLCDKLQREADKAAKRGPRPCMSCSNVFESEGIHNRLCPYVAANAIIWATSQRHMQPAARGGSEHEQSNPHEA